MTDFDLTPELMLHAYAMGVFPMAEDSDSEEVFWLDPQERGVFPLDEFHMSRSLRKFIRTHPVTAELNRDFAATVAACSDRERTWINDDLLEVYLSLHRLGHAHAIEVSNEHGVMGGVFGLTIGGAFFGESMYSAQTNGSKIALAFLIQHLRACGFTLFDTQFVTDHLISLGAIEISRASYHAQLAEAITNHADITRFELPNKDQFLQRSTHTS